MRLKSSMTCFGFIGLAFLAYFNSLNIPFFSDDIANITSRAGLLNDGGPWDAIVHISPDRPLQALLFWLNFKMSALNPLAYRAFGPILLGLLGFAVFRLYALFSELHLLSTDKRGPALIAILYMLWPAHNQAVTLISQRGVLLAALFSTFSLCSFLKHVKHESRSELLLSYLWFLLAILSKGTAIAVLPIILLYVAVYHRMLLRQAVVFAPYFGGTLLLYLAYFVVKLNPQTSPLSPLGYLSVESRVVFIYFKLLFWPFDLRYSYDINLDPNPLRNFGWLAIAGHSAIMGLSLALIKRLPALTFSVVATYLALAPESSIFPIDHVIWEYRTCFPFIFLFGGMGLAMRIAAMHLRKTPRQLVFYASCLLAPIFLAANHARTNEINTPEKWALDVLLKNKRDHQFNFNILADFFYLKKYDEGARLAHDLGRENPDITAYGYLQSIFQAKSERAFAEIKLLEGLASVVRSPDAPLTDTVRTVLNVFIIAELPRHLMGSPLDMKIEDLLFPQIAALGRRAFNSQGLYSTYNVSINRLIDEYEAKQRSAALDPVSLARYLKILAAREVFFGVKSQGLDEKFRTFILKHPQAALTPRIHEWYLAHRSQ